jgi:hypothetical protein
MHHAARIAMLDLLSFPSGPCTFSMMMHVYLNLLELLLCWSLLNKVPAAGRCWASAFCARVGAIQPSLSLHPSFACCHDSPALLSVHKSQMFISLLLLQLIVSASASFWVQCLPTVESDMPTCHNDVLYLKFSRSAPPDLMVRAFYTHIAKISVLALATL